MLQNIRRRAPDPNEFVFRMLGYLMLFLFGIMCVLPFYLIIVSSFASEASLLKNGFQIIPSEFSLDAYHFVFTNPARIGRAYMNTICVTIVGTCLSLMLSTLSGYVLSRRDFKWRNLEFKHFF